MDARCRVYSQILDVAANAGEVKGKLVYVYSTVGPTVLSSTVVCYVFYSCIQRALVMNDHTRSRVRVSACTLYSKYS